MKEFIQKINNPEGIANKSNIETFSKLKFGKKIQYTGLFQPCFSRLVTFHLVLSSHTYEEVKIKTTANISLHTVTHKLTGTVESFLFVAANVHGLSKWGRNSVGNWNVALQNRTIFLLCYTLFMGT